VSFSATLLITRDTAALIAPRIGSSSLVMCPLTRPRFPLLSHPDLSARQTSSSWMILLLMCRPPLDRHLLFPLQDLPSTPPCCHTRHPASPRCHARPMAPRRRPQQAPRLSLDEPGRPLASHPCRWELRRQLTAPADLLHRPSPWLAPRRPLLGLSQPSRRPGRPVSPGRPLRHLAGSLLARLLFTDRSPQRPCRSKLAGCYGS